MSGYQSYNGDHAEGYGSQGRGGGFHSSPSAQRGGGFSTSPSAQASGEKGQQKRREGQSLTPVTIKQLLECPIDSGKFRVDGKELAQVTLVASVVSFEEKPTFITYKVDDGTGAISVRFFIDSENAEKRPMCEPNTYVHVFGNPRVLGDVRQIVGFQATPIKDHNEIAYHMADAKYTHYVNTKGAPQGVPSSTTTSSHPGYTQSGTQDVHMSTSSASVITQQTDGNFTPIQQQVLSVFERDSAASGDSGTSIETVFGQLSHISRRDIETAIEFLSNEGHLYSTIDEHHFKSTASA